MRRPLVRVPTGMETTFRALRAWLDSWKAIGDGRARDAKAVQRAAARTLDRIHRFEQTG